MIPKKSNTNCGRGNVNGNVDDNASLNNNDI